MEGEAGDSTIKGFLRILVAVTREWPSTMILDRKILVEKKKKKIHQDSRLRNPGGELARNTPPRILLKESWWMAGRIGRPYWSHISTAGRACGRGVSRRAGLQSGSQSQSGPAVSGVNRRAGMQLSLRLKPVAPLIPLFSQNLPSGACRSDR